MHLSKFLNVFVQIAKFICLIYKIYLSQSQNTFVQITKYFKSLHLQLLHNLPHATYLHNTPHFRKGQNMPHETALLF